eukprot:2052105-Pleurochrysis_carterae.AAC.5
MCLDTGYVIFCVSRHKTSETKRETSLMSTHVDVLHAYPRHLSIERSAELHALAHVPPAAGSANVGPNTYAVDQR